MIENDQHEEEVDSVRTPSANFYTKEFHTSSPKGTNYSRSRREMGNENSAKI